MSNPYLRKFEGVGENREEVYAEIYDGSPLSDEDISRPPTKRRQKRIRWYKALIGEGNWQILEVGCGLGDLTCGLADNAARAVGIDVSGRMIDAAIARRDKRSRAGLAGGQAEFRRMSATRIDYGNGAFDWAVSTSMIEHLHPEDVQPHLREILRVLKPGGRYLVWAPNRLGHHHDRDFHLSMFSYRELVAEMARAGFKDFHTTFFNSARLVPAGFKIFLESWMFKLGIKPFWSHLGIRNILLVAAK